MSKCRYYTLSVAFTFTIVMLSGCIYEIRKSIDQRSELARELASEPFAMPGGFPVPDEALAVSRPLKGNQIVFETSKSLVEIGSFYDRVLIPAGLYRDPATVWVSDSHFQVGYKGWPNGCLLVIGAADLAFSSNKNKRVVTGDLQQCRD